MTKKTLALTLDQQNAYDMFIALVLSPTEQVLVIEGYSGTGKSTLVQHIFDNLPSLIKMIDALNLYHLPTDILLTATTNKAAENLFAISGEPVVTIHSALSMRVHNDFKTKKSSLIRRFDAELIENKIIFIEEGSKLDNYLLNGIFEYTKNCKYVIMGDPAQLLDIKSSNAPAFLANFPTAKLTQVMRNSGEILRVATQFREMVSTKEMPVIELDNQSLVHLNQDDFLAAAEAEFSRSDWKPNDSRILAYTNNRVDEYNKYLSDKLSGNPELKVGDYAVNNKFITNSKNCSFKTDQVVHITAVSPDYEVYGMTGKWYELDNKASFFMPNVRTHKALALKLAHAGDQQHNYHEILNSWIDLRSLYASTVDKSQGSTYGSVFIDLNDIGRVGNRDRLARMLYVAISRAQHKVVFTGDI